MLIGSSQRSRRLQTITLEVVMSRSSGRVRSIMLVAGLALAAGAAACTEATLPTGAEAAGDGVGGGQLYRVEPSMFPFYSRTEPPADVGGFGYQADGWAAIVFYRDPACVPADFNLFDFYDFAFPRVFFCDPTVSGFSLHHEPLGVTPPKQSNLSGSAVPIWFVPSDGAFADAVAAGQLTIGELEAMPGLVKGTASHFREINHTVGSHPRTKIVISARGTLEDGRRFDYDVTWQGLTVDDVQHVGIRLR
jgi:hypothetical protein